MAVNLIWSLICILILATLWADKRRWKNSSSDSTTRIITIAGSATFSILINSGSRAGTGVYSTAGFTGGADLSGSSSYAGNAAAGTEYLPQTILDNYISSDIGEEGIGASVSVSADNVVQTATFGDVSFTEFNLKYQINSATPGADFIEGNASGVTNLINFMKHLRKKRKFEFMADRDDRDTFEKLLLESAPGNRDGTGFQLERVEGCQHFFSSGVLRCRVID